MEYHNNHKSITNNIFPIEISSEDNYIKRILSKHLDTEIDGVILFIKYIYPFIKRYKNGPILGTKIITDFKLINDGAHGVTFRIQNILIKIFKNTKKSTAIKIAEIENIYKIFYNDDHTKSIVPKQINNFIGFITNDLNVFNKINVKKNKSLINSNIFTNLLSDRISSRDMHSFQKKNNFSSTSNPIYNFTFITSLVLEFEEFEIIQYVSKYVNVSNINNFVNDFINDMYIALRYLHHDKKMIHNDIKYENIVTSFDSELNRYIFKIIDFGLADIVHTPTDIVKVDTTYGTPLFYNGTIFKSYRSFLYDWYCILITIFDLLNLSCRSIDDYSMSDSDSESDFLFIRHEHSDWIRSDLLKLTNVDSYMDYIHETYMSTIDECLIDFMKSIMKFRFYIDNTGSYSINIRKLYDELYLDSVDDKICQKS